VYEEHEAKLLKMALDDDLFIEPSKPAGRYRYYWIRLGLKFDRFRYWLGCKIAGEPL